jgi:hypothetical protein
MSHNLSTDVSEELVDAAANVQWPQVHHDTVVYVAGSPPQVHLLDRLSGTTTVLSPTNSPQKRPRISATAVAWEDEGGTFAQVIRYDRSSGVTTTVDPSGADQRFIALSDQGLVWTDFRDEDPNQRWDGDGNDQSELYGHMTGHSPTALVTAPWKQAFPDIDGSRLIWMDWRDVQYDDASLPQPQPKLSHFYVYQGTLKDGSVTESPLAEVQLGSYEGLPTIAGDWVAWAEDEQIAGLRLGSSEVIALSEVKSGADLPVLSSQGLVFRIGEETLRFAPLPSSAPTTP